MALTVVPNSGQTLNNSRPQIAGNFLSIDTAFSVDHVGYNLPPNSGMHNSVTFPIIPPPAPANPAAGFIGLYGANDTGGAPQIWVNTPTTQYQLTGGSSLAAPNGWTLLPTGIMLQWGSGTIDQGAVETPFTRAFPTACFNVQVTPYYSVGQRDMVQVFNYTVTGFRGWGIKAGGGYESTAVSWFAVGN